MKRRLEPSKGEECGRCSEEPTLLQTAEQMGPAVRLILGRIQAQARKPSHYLWLALTPRPGLPADLVDLIRCRLYVLLDREPFPYRIPGDPGDISITWHRPGNKTMTLSDVYYAHSALDETYVTQLTRRQMTWVFNGILEALSLKETDLQLKYQILVASGTTTQLGYITSGAKRE